MITRRAGVIINNSSIAGLRGMARLSHYAASKWGLVGLTKSWAIELAPYNVRVISLHPTGVNTPMNDGLAALEGATAQEIAERSAGNLLPVPWIEPEDVSSAVVYLASDQSRRRVGPTRPKSMSGRPSRFWQARRKTRYFEKCCELDRNSPELSYNITCLICQPGEAVT